MILVRVMEGDAITPYEVVCREWFHTEFGASLFGWLTSEQKAEKPAFRYWVLDNKIAAQNRVGDSHVSYGELSG